MPVEPNGTFAYWRDPLFLACLGLYAVNRFLIKPYLTAHATYSPLFHGHLNDTLTVPVVLPIYLYIYRKIGFRPDDQPPRWWEVALHVAVWDVFFEWFGPRYLHQGVADPIDSWCIAGGGVVAWVIWWLAHRRGAVPARQD
ncbi:MAG: hypothetical protein WDO13_01875 [Verrucomicrobiota bacterium]